MKPELLTDISSRINKVNEQKSIDFVTLIRAAKLNPKTDLRHHSLKNQDFSYCDLSGFDFTGCDLIGSKFKGAIIAKAKFQDALADIVSLSEAQDWSRELHIHLLQCLRLVPSETKVSAVEAEPVAVIDIGNKKITCLIGAAEVKGGVKIIGAGVSVNSGMKSGVVVDEVALEMGIRAAVEKVERQCGITVSVVAVNLSDQSTRSSHFSLEQDFTEATEISKNLMNELIRSVLHNASREDETTLHAIPLAWKVDDQNYIKNPIGMLGSSFGVDLHLVLTNRASLLKLINCIERCHIGVRSVSSSTKAAGYGVIKEQEMDLGVTIIHLSADVTVAAIFRDNQLKHIETLRVGGENITKDIARGLSTTLEAAERIKILYGTLLNEAGDENNQIPVPPLNGEGELEYVSKETLKNIIFARAEETLEILRERISTKSLSEFETRKIILTGGGANLTGIKELATKVFEKKVRIGHPCGVSDLESSMSGTENAVAAGLLKLQFDSTEDIVGSPKFPDENLEHPSKKVSVVSRH